MESSVKKKNTLNHPYATEHRSPQLACSKQTITQPVPNLNPGGKAEELHATDNIVQTLYNQNVEEQEP